jgi:hypothetical protein
MVMYSPVKTSEKEEMRAWNHGPWSKLDNLAEMKWKNFSKSMGI